MKELFYGNYKFVTRSGAYFNIERDTVCASRCWCRSVDIYEKHQYSTCRIILKDNGKHNTIN